MRRFHNPIAVAGYSLLFGCLMAAQHEVSGWGARVLLGAGAGVTLGLLLRASRGPMETDSKQPTQRP